MSFKPAEGTCVAYMCLHMLVVQISVHNLPRSVVQESVVALAVAIRSNAHVPTHLNAIHLHAYLGNMPWVSKPKKVRNISKIGECAFVLRSHFL